MRRADPVDDRLGSMRSDAATLRAVLLGLIGLLVFTEFYRVLLGLNRFDWVVPSFRVFLPTRTSVYRVLPSLTGFDLISLVSTEFYRVFIGLTRFDWVLPSFSVFYLLSLVFLRVLPSFLWFD